MARGTVNNTRDLRELGLKIRQKRSGSKRILPIKNALKKLNHMGKLPS